MQILLNVRQRNCGHDALFDEGGERTFPESSKKFDILIYCEVNPNSIIITLIQIQSFIECLMESLILLIGIILAMCTFSLCLLEYLLSVSMGLS